MALFIYQSNVLWGWYSEFISSRIKWPACEQQTSLQSYWCQLSSRRQRLIFLFLVISKNGVIQNWKSSWNLLQDLNPDHFFTKSFCKCPLVMVHKFVKENFWPNWIVSVATQCTWFEEKKNYSSNHPQVSKRICPHTYSECLPCEGCRASRLRLLELFDKRVSVIWAPRLGGDSTTKQNIELFGWNMYMNWSPHILVWCLTLF